MLVEVTEARLGDYRPVILAMGTVEPEHDVSFQARVGGRIISRSEHFTPGGVVEKGLVLVEIDPADYENSLKQRQSALDRAMSDLAMEMGRQNVARHDYQALGRQLSDEHRDLVLRRPQLNAARADVKDAEAAVDQARLDLDRTRVKAPFDAQVLSREADVGSRVSEGETLGRLVGTKTGWVASTVPQSSLRWLAFTEKDGHEGSVVHIRNRGAWPEDEFRTGRLWRLVGALEADTRLALVLVAVDDPFARKKSNSGKPPLLINSFVEVSIEGRLMTSIIRLERDNIRKNNTVWIMKDGRLEIRQVDTVFSDARYAYIRDGVKDSEKVITSNLATVAEGARLRLKDAEDGGRPESGSGGKDNNNAVNGG